MSDIKIKIIPFNLIKVAFENGNEIYLTENKGIRLTNLPPKIPRSILIS